MVTWRGDVAWRHSADWRTRPARSADQRIRNQLGEEARMDQLLLLFALARHLIAARTGASGLAPFEQARKDAALSRRRT